MLNFKKLNLNPTIIAALEKKGYSTPTPIQEQAIPHLLEGKDLLGIAQTGTGKTAAFALPIIDRLAKNPHSVKANQIRALILTPTRELATQIGDNIKLYGHGLHLKHAVIFGGVNEFHQIEALKKGLDIVVATPGRLLDLMSQGHVRFSQIEIFVLDEADRMLDMGFINDVKKIISKLPQTKQSLLFSATMPAVISGLAHSILKNPVKVEITPQSTTVERINQKVYMVAKGNKPALLLDVLTKPDVVAALVFSRTKHGANKVVTYLEKYGVNVAAIHGNKSQAAREKALGSLREGKIKVLVATDIAARGIDVPSISHVINYDIPADPESYVHRIGRTARAGRDGIAISFCDAGETLALRAVEKAIRMKIPVDETHPFHGKAGAHDSSEGRILSRGNGGNRFNSRAKSDDGAVRRSGNSTRPAQRSSTHAPKNQFAKSTRTSTNHNSKTENGESTTKKILRKFGFGLFGKKSAEAPESGNRNSFRPKNRNKKFNHNKNRSRSNFSER